MITTDLILPLNRPRLQNSENIFLNKTGAYNIYCSEFGVNIDLPLEEITPFHLIQKEISYQDLDKHLFDFEHFFIGETRFRLSTGAIFLKSFRVMMIHKWINFILLKKNQKIIEYFISAPSNRNQHFLFQKYSSNPYIVQISNATIAKICKIVKDSNSFDVIEATLPEFFIGEHWIENNFSRIYFKNSDTFAKNFTNKSFVGELLKKKYHQLSDDSKTTILEILEI